MADEFAARTSVEQVEEGAELAPKFDVDGLIPAVTTDAATGELLMVGYMNAEALRKTIETGEAHYWSRSRQVLWHKGATSGLVQKVDGAHDRRRSGLRVAQGRTWPDGASCHVGYRTCFYRRVPLGRDASKALEFTETRKSVRSEGRLRRRAEPDQALTPSLGEGGGASFSTKAGVTTWPCKKTVIQPPSVGHATPAACAGHKEHEVTHGSALRSRIRAFR